MPKVKSVFVGDAGVGKTCIVTRITRDVFSEDGQATVGAANSTVFIDSEENGKIEFCVWDTAGQERYRSLAPMYFNGASLAFLVFDITNTHSFEALDSFVDLLRQKAPEWVKFILIGNKADLSSKRQVTSEVAEDYAAKIGAEFYIETSAKSGIGVNELFERAATIELHFEQELVQMEFTADDKSKQQKQCC